MDFIVFCRLKKFNDIQPNWGYAWGCERQPYPLKYSDAKIRNLPLKTKPYKLAFGGGLFLLVKPNKTKVWRYKYRIYGKEKLLTLGRYPEVLGAEALEKHLAARKLVADNIDPSETKQAANREAKAKLQNTFGAVAKQWWETRKPKWTPDHATRIWRRLEINIFPKLEDTPIKEIKRAEMLAAIQKIEKRGATHLSHKVLQTCAQIFRYAIVHELAEVDITAHMSAILVAHQTRHYPAIELKELNDFLKSLDTVSTSIQNKLGIRMLLLTFVRPGELRKALWNEIDFDAAEWRIPAEKMKKRERHIVPLSTKAIQVLRELQVITGHSKYLFPTQNTQKNPYMSENTLNVVIKKMGYGGKMVSHGFRRFASTALNEKGLPGDVIERQLAHRPRDTVRAAYNFAEYLAERRIMMQTWADYLDEITIGSKHV